MDSLLGSLFLEWTEAAEYFKISIFSKNWYFFFNGSLLIHLFLMPNWHLLWLILEVIGWFTGRSRKNKGKGVYASLFGVGAPEALVIGVVALLVFGPKGLAEVCFAFFLVHKYLALIPF